MRKLWNIEEHNLPNGGTVFMLKSLGAGYCDWRGLEFDGSSKVAKFMTLSDATSFAMAHGLHVARHSLRIPTRKLAVVRT